MSHLAIEGSPALVTRLEQELRNEFAALDLGSQVTIDTQIEAVPTAPGDLGFGEEIKRILLAFGNLLQAVPNATEKIAEGIANRLAADRLSATVGPDGTIRVSASGRVDAAETTRAIAQVLAAQRATP